MFRHKHIPSLVTNNIIVCDLNLTKFSRMPHHRKLNWISKTHRNNQRYIKVRSAICTIDLWAVTKKRRSTKLIFTLHSLDTHTNCHYPATGNLFSAECNKMCRTIASNYATCLYLRSPGKTEKQKNSYKIWQVFICLHAWHGQSHNHCLQWLSNQ